METMIALLVITDVSLFILLIVASMARMDRRYAAIVRKEHDRKSLLRGHRDDVDQL